VKKRAKREPVSPQTESRLGEALASLATGVPVEEVASTLARGAEVEAGLELAAALARQDTPQAAELARDLSGVFPVREVRRAFKRTLYLLEQKGFRPQPRPGEPPPLRAPEAVRLPAFVSLPDPAGHQMVVAAVPGRGGYDACLCSVSPEGVEHFMLVAVPKRGIKELAAKVEEDSGLPITETEPAHARSLLEEAQGQSTAGGRGLAPEFAPFLQALSALAGRVERPPVYGLLDEAEVGEDAALLEISPELLESIGILWTLPVDDVRPYVTLLEAADSVGLVLTPEQRRERLLDIVRKAAAELFDTERRRAWRRRLEESAYVLARRGKGGEARIALAAAIDLGREPNGPNPLVLALVGRSMVPLLKEAKAEEGEPSLIIRP
jgi:hypothetical protein